MRSRKSQLIDLILTPAFATMFMLGIFLVFLLWYVGSLASTTVYEREFVSRNFALMIDTLLTIPGNINVLFQPSKNLQDFSYEVQSDNVIVRDKDGFETKHFFLPNYLINIELSEGKLTDLRFVKPGNKIIIADSTINQNLYALNCPSEKVEVKSIVVDPGHAYNPERKQFDSGYVFGEKLESEETKAVARALQIPSQFVIKFTRSITPGIDQLISVGQRINTIKAENSDLLLSLHFSNEPELFIKAFIPYPSKNFDKSQRIACEILNSLAQALINNNYPLEGVAVIPRNSELTSDNSDDVLLRDQASVLLELGSLKYNIDPAIVGHSILEGVKNGRT